MANGDSLDAQLQALIHQAVAMAGAGAPASSQEAAPRTLASYLPAWARDAKILQQDELRADPDQIPLVYWGQGTRTETMNVSGEPEFIHGAPDVDGQIKITEDFDKMMSVSSAKGRVYAWDTGEVRDAIKRLNKLGYGVESFEDLEAVWGAAVDRAAATLMATDGERKLTPWDVLEMGSDEMELIPGDTNGDGKLGPGDAGYNGRKVTTHKSIDTITEGEAWSTMQQTVSQMLGRDPSDNEIRDFTHRMNRMAASNPAISRTVTRFRDGEAVSSTTRETDGGFSAADMAQAAYDRAQNDADYAEYQAATTYFNALQSALGPIGG